jgi:RNA polymerase sigma-70 factor (ECF subfamily)
VTEVAAVLDRAYRDERLTVLATLVRHVGGDLGLAEDAVQDAFTAAAAEWPRRGVPRRPGAWLTVTARRRAIDRMRREQTRAAHQPALEQLQRLAWEDRDHDPAAAAGDDTGAATGREREDGAVTDDRLRLIFTCCHPALALDARLALTLKAVGGLDVPQLARAFLTSETAMYQRLTRAKRKIVAAGIPYRVPPDGELPGRLAGVRQVVYLLFNEGHLATAGRDLVGGELCDEAVRLARLLAELVPGDAETLGLLALLLLTDARRDARSDEAGEPVALDHQDRSLWDRAEIAEGLDVVERALRLGRPGPYQVQAAIAACHAEAASFATTDWAQVAELYRVLEALDPSPVVTVNRAVAVACVEGAEAGLALLDGLAGDERLDRYPPLHAARAELLRRSGDRAGADAAHRRAVELTTNDAARAALERRAAELARTAALRSAGGPAPGGGRT